MPVVSPQQYRRLKYYASKRNASFFDSIMLGSIIEDDMAGSSQTRSVSDTNLNEGRFPTDKKSLINS